MKKMRQAAKRTGAITMAAMMAMGGLPQTALADGEDVTTISLYPANGSLSSGVVSGYLGDFFASKGLEVEVWAYSDEKTNLWNTSWILNPGEYTSYLGYDEQPVTIGHGGWAEEMQYTTDTDNFNSWRTITGYDSWYDWLEEENAWCKESVLDNVDQFCSDPDSIMQLTVDAIRETVVTASWKMVYAQTQEEFDSLWESMVSDCEGLGAQDVIDWRLADIENAKGIRDSLK